MDFSGYRAHNCCRIISSSRRALFLPFAALALAGLCAASPASATNPGYDRPGFGFTPVALSAGEMTLEQGLPDWSRDHQGGVSSAEYSADTLLRIGIGGALELQLGASPWNAMYATAGGRTERSSGRGNSTLGMKLALPSANPAFSWGLVGSVEFTDGAPTFGADHRQYLLAAQFNLQVDTRQSLGLYLQDVRSAGTDAALLAISDSITLSDARTLYIEAAQVHTPTRGKGTCQVPDWPGCSGGGCSLIWVWIIASAAPPRNGKPISAWQCTSVTEMDNALMVQARTHRWQLPEHFLILSTVS